MGFIFNKDIDALPNLKDFNLKSYSVELPLDRLVVGTDNIRFDVHLSEGFLSASKKMALRLIARHANFEPILRIDKTTNWIKERDEFRRVLSEMMTGAINKAKMGKEIQIDYLAQVALVKALLQVVKEQYEEFVRQFKEVIRIQEVSDRENQNKVIKLKEALNAIGQKKSTIFFGACKELFGYFEEVQQKQANEAREANFGLDSILNQDLFTNPMLFVENPSYDFFMIEEYDILLGHRLEDPDKYETLLYALKNLFMEIDVHHAIIPESESLSLSGIDTPETRYGGESTNGDALDRCLTHLDNLDILFDYVTSKKNYRFKKQHGAHRDELAGIRNHLKKQKKLLNYFYAYLNKTGLVKRIVAYYEIKPVYHEYCPPLRPQQVLQFLISGKQRKQIVSQLSRLKGYYAKPLILKPLKKRIWNIEKIGSQKKKEYLLTFIKGFARYHRDHMNYQVFKNAMENLNIVVDEKLLNLSRTNNTLYEYLLSHEEVLVEKPIVNHVIIKADVRGSTDITYRMRENGLNPASYFSLNFFDPITDILPAFGAVKVFIEGDAIILAIYEQKDSPGERYNVARACGLALNMLFIVLQYNKSSKTYNLPIMELGVGICFYESSPAFLFDGDHKIMISPAINLADRLSACSKTLRRIKTLNESPFNLHVFQDAGLKQNTPSVDDVYLRYNVNGIELNETGFKKLREEIDLKVLDYKETDGQYILYGGKFPTVSGKYQQLIIREAQIPIIDMKNYRITGLSPDKYYEVCTDPKLYEVVKRS